ncbi:MAG: hypothetical protein M3O06_01825 [Pseudomonadota bacterium]|nr:hypothetical protein [Pseudomonadota bacterium]
MPSSAAAGEAAAKIIANKMQRIDRLERKGCRATTRAILRENAILQQSGGAWRYNLQSTH